VNNKIYLSIDIDFWRTPKVAQASLIQLFDKLPTDIDRVAVMNHQQLEKFVSKSNARTLINIDTHSDLSEASTTDFNCGTWVAYVSWRKEGKYIWYRGHNDTDVGSCNSGKPWMEGTDWLSYKTAFRKQSFDFSSKLDISNVVGVGLCLSPSYNGDGCSAPGYYYANHNPDDLRMEKVFKFIVNKYNLPYLKGRRIEHFGRDRHPSGRKVLEETWRKERDLWSKAA
jgi:hypothetical protein